MTSMIECCGHLQKAKVFRLEDKPGYKNSVMKRLVWNCPHCGSQTIQLERNYFDKNKIEQKEIKIKTKADADKLYQKLKFSIVYEIKKNNIVGGRWYLIYSEYGKKKKCYSNLSTLKMGLTDNSVGIADYQKEQNYLDVG